MNRERNDVETTKRQCDVTIKCLLFCWKYIDSHMSTSNVFFILSFVSVCEFCVTMEMLKWFLFGEFNRCAEEHQHRIDPLSNEITIIKDFKSMSEAGIWADFGLMCAFVQFIKIFLYFLLLLLLWRSNELKKFTHCAYAHNGSKRKHISSNFVEFPSHHFFRSFFTLSIFFQLHFFSASFIWILCSCDFSSWFSARLCRQAFASRVFAACSCVCKVWGCVWTTNVYYVIRYRNITCSAWTFPWTFDAVSLFFQFA